MSESATVLRLDGSRENVYDHPELHGLKIVDEVDYSSGSYEFDKRVIWQDGEGRLWTYRDSGCSCPTPFEGTEELERLFSFEFLQDEYDKESIEYRDDRPSPLEWREFEKTIRAAFAGASTPA